MIKAENDDEEDKSFTILFINLRFCLAGFTAKTLKLRICSNPTSNYKGLKLKANG